MTHKTYRIEHIDHCVLVYGHVPLSALEPLTRLAPPDAVMDLHLARLTGASLAMGLASNTKALAAKQADAVLAHAQQAYSKTRLSAEAIRWLALGERGLSSDTMFYRLTGIRPNDLYGAAKDHPCDPDDLRRCRLLLKQVPELAPQVDRMAEVSPTWQRLADNWNALCNRMDEENPEWASAKGCAPKTAERMRVILAEPVA